MTSKVKDAVQRQKSRRRHVLPAAAFLVRAGMMCLVLGAAAFGLWALWLKALADPRFRISGETLALAGAVRECPESVEGLEAIGRRFNGRSLLDPRLISDMEKAYGENRWIRKVVCLRRKFPNRVEVQFLLRVPAAQVWQDGRYWLVDDEAALLPVEGTSRMFASLPEIVGVTQGVIGNRPATGEIWRDEGVAGGLGIVRSFWGSPLAEVLPIAKVVVNAGPYRNASEGAPNSPEPMARRRFELVTDQGAVVRWGTFNPGDLEGEPTSAEKLWNLQDLMRRKEAGTPGVCFDVRTKISGYTLSPEG